MFKKLLVISALAFWAQLGFAATEINTADKAALQSVKDVGPQTADAIVAERTKGGKFKDWDDLVKRVKGVGPKNSVEMSQAGLTVNGQAKPKTPAKAVTAAKPSAKPMPVAKEKSNATKEAKPAKEVKATDMKKETTKK